MKLITNCYRKNCLIRRWRSPESKNILLCFKLFFKDTWGFEGREPEACVCEGGHEKASRIAKVKCERKMGRYSLTESLWDFAVVHLGILVGDLSALKTWPDHKCVHWSFYVIHLQFLSSPQRAAKSHPHWTHSRTSWGWSNRHPLHASKCLRKGTIAHIAAGSVK